MPAYNLDTKAEIYAAHAVPEYWVVDLATDRVVRMSRPSAGKYDQVEVTAFGTPINAITIPGLTVATDALT